MRINVYSQELLLEETDRATETVEQTADTDVVYSGVRMFLHSSDRLHDRRFDDDRTAITFWLPKSKEKREQLAYLFEEMAMRVRNAKPETGLD